MCSAHGRGPHAAQRCVENLLDLNHDTEEMALVRIIRRLEVRPLKISSAPFPVLRAPDFEVVRAGS